MKRGSWSTTKTGISLVISAVLVFSFILANPAAAILDGPGEIQTGPYIAYQNVPFDYHVKITNSGNENLHVTDVMVTIKWPGDWMFPDDEFTNPTESYEIFAGDQVINAGDSHDFKGNIWTGSWGGFPVIVTITAKNESDSTLSTKTYEASINFESASRAPFNRAILFPIMLPVFFGAFLVGFYLRRTYWGVEIDNAMKNGNPGEFGFTKWWQYYWERDGMMWKNYLIWVVIASILAALIAFL